MKKMFKTKFAKVLVAVSIVAIALTTYANTFVKVTAATTPSGNVIVGPGKLNSISIYNPSTVPTTVYFFDSSTSNYLYSVGAFTNYTTTTVTASTVYTNFFGVRNTNTFTYKSNVLNAVAAASYSNRLVNVIYVPASNTVSSTLVSPIMLGLGYTSTVTAGSNLVITVDFNKFQ